MIDITKDEFWGNRYEEVNKREKQNSKIKEFVVKNKTFTILLISLGILMVANTILIYNFFRILTNL